MLKKILKYIGLTLALLAIVFFCLCFFSLIEKRRTADNGTIFMKNKEALSDKSIPRQYIVFDSVWIKESKGVYKQRYDGYEIIDKDTIYVFSSYIYRYHYEEMEE